MTEKKMWKHAELTCKPLDTYEDITNFIENPPSWRSLCTEINPHSEKVIKNMEVNNAFDQILLETPHTFCHFDPETKEVSRYDRKSVPRTLVCHDMANGYHDDSYIDGTGNHDVYTFFNWAAIDIFCYFSHHLITIPPLGWINVGHAHGVKVIGTVITEWAEGVSFWAQILQSESTWQTFASALVAIAKTLKFDGWLLNIENKIANPEALLEFVKCLHTTLHQELVDPVLIWYDSVTVEGHLNWQNGLNEKNKKFFDVVDGLFTNYSWSEEDVRSSVAAAGARVTDLYIGIDVWGRNFLGGGQFNTQEAVDIAYSYGCSLAIFAPAWTHEAMVYNNKADASYIAGADELVAYEHFLLRERALWGSLWPYFFTKLPCTLPFQTSFCRGQGLKRRLYGEVICPVPWFNLRHMQYQPNSSHGPHGYLLSTQENITKMSQFGLLKDKTEIMNYRQSMEASRMDFAAEDNKEENTEPVLPLKNDSLTVVNEQTQCEIPERNTVKRKMQNAFRHLFKIKRKSATREKEEFEPTTTHSSSGRSMVRMSVHLRLNKLGKIRIGLGFVENELECLEPFFEDSFLGGSCLKVNPSDEVSTEHRLIRIFHCDFPCNDSLIVCVVTKKLEGHKDQFLNIKLYMKDASDKEMKVILVGRNIPHVHEDSRKSFSEIINLYPETGSDFRAIQKYLLLNQPNFYVPVENDYNWKVRYYLV